MIEPQDIVEQYKAGSIDRRSAVRQFFALGVTAPAAYAALGEMDGAAAQSLPSPMPDPQAANALTHNFAALSRLVSSPEMQTAMDLAEKEKDRQKAAKILADAAYAPALRQKVGLTDTDLRTSMRVFERDPTAGDKVIATTRRIGVDGLTKFAHGSAQPTISDDEIQKFVDQMNGGKPYDDLNNPKPKPKPPLSNATNIARSTEGVCVSYGKDLCVSAGVP